MFWKFWYWVSIRLFYNQFLGKRQWPSHFCKQMTQLVRLTSTLNFKLSVRPAKIFIEWGTSFIDTDTRTDQTCRKEFPFMIETWNFSQQVKKWVEWFNFLVDSVKPVQIETWCSLVFDNSRRSHLYFYSDDDDKRCFFGKTHQ